jgi:hypothetical protein
LSLEKSHFDKASHDQLHLYPYSHIEKKIGAGGKECRKDCAGFPFNWLKYIEL